MSIFNRSKTVLVFFAVLLFAALTSTPAQAARVRPFLGSFPATGLGADTGAAVDQETGNVFGAGTGAGGVPEVAVFGPEGGAPVGGAVAVVALPFFAPFAFPRGVAVDNSCFYHEPRLTGSECEALDPSNGDLYVIGSTEVNPGGAVIQLALDRLTGQYELVREDPFASPEGVAVDHHGDVYVASDQEAAVTELSAAGVQLAKIEQSLVAKPSYLAIGAPGTLYIGGDPGVEGTVARVRFATGGTVEEQQLLDASSTAGPVSVDQREHALVEEGLNDDEVHRIVEYGAGGAVGKPPRHSSGKNERCLRSRMGPNTSTHW